ncbi:MAG: hypothetical protein V1738_03995 [Patescibacteria group bacterium]
MPNRGGHIGKLQIRKKVGMDIQNVVYLIASSFVAIGLLLFWFFVWRTPLRHLFAIALRYRAVRRLDWLATIGKNPSVRAQRQAIRSYEETFDCILILRSLDNFYSDELGVKWTEASAADGRSVANDLADIFAAYANGAIFAIANHLQTERFSSVDDRSEILAFLFEERRLILHEPAALLEHPDRLWRKFGHGPIYGWRTTFMLPYPAIRL